MLHGIMLDITKEKIKEREAEERHWKLQRERAERQEFETAKEALRKSEERYRSLVEATSQIVWDTKANGEFVSEQPGWSAFTGQSLEEYLGWGWLTAVHPDDRAQTAQAWNHALATQTMYQVEHRLRRQDGMYREMSVRAVPVLETDGTVREWIGIHSDITDSKKEDLEDVLTNDARQQMKLLRGRVHRMEGLIDGILQYSRAGRFKGKLERLSVQQLLQETIELLSPPPEVQIYYSARNANAAHGKSAARASFPQSDQQCAEVRASPSSQNRGRTTTVQTSVQAPVQNRDSRARAESLL